MRKMVQPDPGMGGDMDKKSKTPSPFEKVDGQGQHDGQDQMQQNGIMQNGIKEEPMVYG